MGEAPRNSPYARVEAWSRTWYQHPADELFKDLAKYEFNSEERLNSAFCGRWVTWDAVGQPSRRDRKRLLVWSGGSKRLSAESRARVRATMNPRSRLLNRSPSCGLKSVLRAR